MTKSLKLLNILLLSLLIGICTMSSDVQGAPAKNPQTVPMQKKNKKDKEIFETDPVGHRSPSRPLICYISEDSGIQILDFSDEILEYEICNPENEECIAYFSDESEFLSFLFSIPGDYLIKFSTEDFELIGYITIE